MTPHADHTCYNPGDPWCAICVGEAIQKHSIECPVCETRIEIGVTSTARRHWLTRRWVVSIDGDWADFWAHIWTHEAPR